jgi:hypothetical protein
MKVSDSGVESQKKNTLLILFQNNIDNKRKFGAWIRLIIAKTLVDMQEGIIK